MTAGAESREDTSSGGELGLLDAVMIGMGAMIGADIFVLTGLAADIAGPAAIVVFGLNGIVTTFTPCPTRSCRARSRRAAAATPRELSLGGIESDLGVVALALAVVALFTLLNVLSASASGQAETVVTMIKIAILLVFVAFGVAAASANEFTRCSRWAPALCSRRWA